MPKKLINFQEVFEGQRQDYLAAKHSRFVPRLTGVDFMGSGADFHYRKERDYLHMLERARDFERNDYVVGAGLNRLVSNVMQDGFTPDPSTGSDELNKALKSDGLLGQSLLTLATVKANSTFIKSSVWYCDR